MEYGRITATDLEKADTRLPPDAAGNDAVLQKGRGSTKFYMGTPKWGRKEWIGTLYPKGTKDAQFLEQYLKHYNSIEFNATHYKTFTPDEIEKWSVKAAGKNFKFCPKVTNSISHYSGFDNVEGLTNTFLEGISAFGNLLGPVFLQISEKYNPKQREKLFRYLKMLPAYPCFFLEVRHPEWFTDPVIRRELFDMLRQARIGAVITDTLPHREVIHMSLTIPKVFIRFTCQGDHHSDISRIDDWVKRIKEWQVKGLEECYFFVHVLNEGLSPEITRYVSQQFNAICNAGLPEVKLLTMF